MRVSKLGEATAETFETVGEATAETVSEAAADTAETTVDLAAAATSVAEPTAEVQPDEAAESEVDADLEAERAEAKHAQALAREPYLSLTKAELSALLAERGLPKTGTIAALIERLVAADSQS